MRYFSDARTEARRLLAEQGPRAILSLSDQLAAAMRSGDLTGADRIERIMVEAEREVDGEPVPRRRLFRWRRTAAAVTVPCPAS